MTDIDIVAELRGFAEWWRSNPQNGDVIYALAHIDGERSVTASGLDRAADEIERLRDQVDSMQMANDMLRATHKTDNQYLLDEIERLRGEGDWEYGVLDPNGDLMYVAISLESATHGGFGPVVRRRPAGPWEPISEGEGDA